MRTIGCVARRIAEKMNTSLADLSVEELAVHIYGDANWMHQWCIRRTLRTMRLPEGWGILFSDGLITRLTRCSTQPRGRRWYARR
jgi:hypothetical protein